MISAGDFRNGVTMEIDGNVCQIVEFQHVKPGKDAAFVENQIQKYHYRSCTGEIFPSNREVPAGTYRPCRHELSVQRWRSLQLHEC